ncbi:MAG: hypothetical protein ABF714_03400, partial [Novacetimonas hansenii]
LLHGSPHGPGHTNGTVAVALHPPTVAPHGCGGKPILRDCAPYYAVPDDGPDCARARRWGHAGG